MQQDSGSESGPISREQRRTLDVIVFGFSRYVLYTHRHIKGHKCALLNLRRQFLPREAGYIVHLSKPNPTREEYPATDYENLCLVDLGKCGLLITTDVHMQHAH